MTPAARLESAIALLSAISADRRPADAVANEYFRARRYIGSTDRREVSDIVWRILRIRRRLGWWLTRLGLQATPYLLVAAAQLFDGWTFKRLSDTYSGDHYAPSKIPQAEGARLQTLQDTPLIHPEMGDATRLELPDWLLPRLRARFGDQLDAELAAVDGIAHLDLRVNLLKATREEALEALRAENLTVEPTPLSPWGMRIKGRRPVTSGPAFQSGLVEIQDEGSQVLARLVDAQPDMRVADYCAGAGGKTLAIAMAMNNRGHIVACDVSKARLEGAVKRLRRAGVHNVEQHLLVAGDKWAKRRAKTFDRVLVDAPCTGTGTWRRNPDARLRLTETDLAELIPKQAAILQTASTLVKPGGRLIYATCSLLPEENEAQVHNFLAANPTFSLVTPPSLWDGHEPRPMLSLTPLAHGTDGFFGAVMERAQPAPEAPRETSAPPP